MVRLIRDLGMVIASPAILMDSSELPMVCPDLLGGGSKGWSESVTWLSTLDIHHVKQWFGSRSNNGRLGEHFALCIQYVLLFSPVVHVSNLLTSQQVKHRAIFQSASEIPEVEISNNKKERQVVLKVGVEQASKDVLIKWDTGYEDNLHMDVSSIIDASKICKGVDNLAIGDEKMQGENTTESFEGKHEKVGKRNKKLLRKIQRLKDGKGPNVTIGEFDFLFQQIPDISCQETTELSIAPCLGIDETKIKHWEVSVKFLLYAGPWETFELETPSYAAWKRSNEDPRKQGASENNAICHTDFFLGCFLGPHVGETLYDRKIRLMRQLLLSQNGHAASLLHTFFASDNSDTSLNSDHERKDCNENRQTGVLRVSPQALLKGYLFYEYELWCHLYPRADMHTSETLCAKSKLVNCSTYGDDNVSNAKLSPHHWNGWWACLSEFRRFARLPAHANSKWYIVHKLAWLSPVVIVEEVAWRKHVLTVDEFVAVAEKVEEEANKMRMPRKRRFMVAEMSWELSSAGRDILGALNGKWSEVSRGFIVEDTWPDSRVYEPHGYKLSL